MTNEHKATTMRSWYRFVVVGLVVFLANAGLLVLQLVAGKLLAPFVGSSLETWTTTIGVFLSGIAVGNAVGGRIADRWASPRRLALILVLGACCALWMVAFPWLLQESQVHRSLSLFVRIPVLAVLLCFPAGFVLSLLTAPAIKLGLSDVRFAGRTAGSIFALSTLGCLVGNYVTGFVLIPSFTINLVVFVTAGGLLLTAVAALLIPQTTTIENQQAEQEDVPNATPLPFARAAAIVFLCSFAGMTLELTASRIIAQNLGVSLYTWTGIIGVMLAGTALGNWLGGRLADSAAAGEGRLRLGMYLLFAGFGIGMVMVIYAVVINVPEFREAIMSSGLILRVLVWTFLLFFLPMLALGTISPQVIKLTIPSLSQAGRTAGRVYAWSTAGAIVGTFAAGYLLISGIGMFRTILLAAILPAAALVILGNPFKHNVLLYGVSILFGAVSTGAIRYDHKNVGVALETNYYTIRVTDTVVTEDVKHTIRGGNTTLVIEDPNNTEQESDTETIRFRSTALTENKVVVSKLLERIEQKRIKVRELQLDYLIHSTVNLADPTYFYYKHEYMQLEHLRMLAKQTPAEQRVLVVGGGGYTFPRSACVQVPTVTMDVVEIDPGVTQIAYELLGLDRKLKINNFNEDGRQFIEEKAEKQVYDLITLDAVNDLSVPGHLLTKEFNAGVRKSLKPNGIYLVTVIDILEYGKLWKAVFHTLKADFAYVTLLTSDDDYDATAQKVYCIYASDVPLNLNEISAAQEGKKLYTRVVPTGELDRLLATEKPMILTDQYAPTDNMMSGIFKRRGN